MQINATIRDIGISINDIIENMIFGNFTVKKIMK